MDNVQDVSFEASMVPPTPETPPLELQCISSQSSGDVESMLSQIVNLNANNILHEPTCLICSSPYREELEKKWSESQETERAKVVKELFESRSKAQVSKDLIENHMRFHYNKGIPAIQQREYINKIKRLNDSQLTTLDRVKSGLSMLMERVMGVNSITPNGDLSMAEVEKIKSAETARLMMAFNQLLKLQAGIMGEMRSSGELITIPKDNFVSIFKKALIDAKTDNERKCINKLLSDLADLSKKVQ